MVLCVRRSVGATLGMSTLAVARVERGAQGAITPLEARAQRRIAIQYSYCFYAGLRRTCLDNAFTWDGAEGAQVRMGRPSHGESKQGIPSKCDRASLLQWWTWSTCCNS